jgi:WD40 repeat protein
MRTYDLPDWRLPPDALQFSPDGRLLALQALGRIGVLDLTSGAFRLVHRGTNGKLGTAGVGFTADSGGVVYLRNFPNNVHVYDLATGADRILLAGVDSCATQTTGHLTFVAHNPEAGVAEVLAIDPRSGKWWFTFAEHNGSNRELAVSWDGKHVVTASAHELRVWRAAARKIPLPARWHHRVRGRDTLGNLALSRDGTYVAVGGYNALGTVRLWNVTSESEVDLAASLGNLRGGGVAFAPDRDLFAFSQNKEVLLWDVTTGRVLQRYDWQLGEIEAIAFAPDGCRCATASASKVLVWDVG